MDFSQIFNLMVEKRASHFHIVPGSPIMMRQENVFMPLNNEVLTPADIEDFTNFLMDQDHKQKYERDLETDFSHSIPGLSRFRINIFKQRGTSAIVISTNPPSPPTIDELGLPDVIKNLAVNTKHGLIIICGPKSSGKSHTLAAIINYILEMRTCQIVTLENPIDFLHRNKKGIICQRELGTDTRSYGSAFHSLVHQGADVLVITDFNTYEVANHALNLAAGGSLVIATAQAPSVMVMMEKLIDMFPPHLKQQVCTLLGVGMEAIVCQTLLAKATGAGMVPAFEILIGTPQIKGFLRDGKTIQIQQSMGTSGREFGMQSQEQALRYLVKKNIVTQEEATSKAVRPEEFKKLMSLPY
ncbi:MAG: Flp pilus assembly complex ATPase component TadA [Chloroflexi bacterium]|nr:Flp pilus assembly complex ATPase component TadA [Chloroflexota bacterium]